MVITANMPVSSIVNVWPKTKITFKSYHITTVEDRTIQKSGI